jgi:hypothetical protein
METKDNDPNNSLFEGFSYYEWQLIIF